MRRVMKVLLILTALSVLVFAGFRVYGAVVYHPSEEAVPPSPRDENFLVSPVDPEHIYEDGLIRFAANEIILSRWEDVSFDQAAAWISGRGWEMIGYDKPLGFFQVRLPSDAVTEEAFETYRDEAMESALFEDGFRNHIISLSSNANISDDREYKPFVFHADRYWGQTAIHLHEAYDRLEGVDLQKVSVGVIDGQFKIHDDILFGNTQGAIFDSEAEDASHGLHVAGIIGAIRNNNLGIGGVNDKIQLCCYGDRSFDTDSTFTWLTAISTLHYYWPCKVINISQGISWKNRNEITNDDGSPMTREDYEITVRKALEDDMCYVRSAMRKLIRKRDFLLVVAAGNDNNIEQLLGIAKYGSPFAFIEDEDIKSHIIIVGNVCRGEEPEVYNIHESSNYGDRVDILAPGTDIYSTVEKKNEFNSFLLGQDVYESGYEFYSGTSMAAPYVTGVASLLWGINPDLTAAQVKEMIINSAEKSCTYHKGKYYRDEWHLMMDADRAVAAALDTLSAEAKETGVSWQSLYRSIISSGSYGQHIIARDKEYDGALIERDSVYDRMALHDFDSDGIPELLIGTSYGIEQTDVFGIDSGRVTHMGVIGGDNFFNSVFFFNDLSYPWLFTAMGGPAQSIEAWWIEHGIINTRSIASTIVNSEGDETTGISMQIQDDKLEQLLWKAVAGLKTSLAKELMWFVRSELLTEDNWTFFFDSATKFS